jgi:hypothetical protein
MGAGWKRLHLAEPCDGRLRFRRPGEAELAVDARIDASAVVAGELAMVAQRLCVLGGGIAFVALKAPLWALGRCLYHQLVSSRLAMMLAAATAADLESPSISRVVGYRQSGTWYQSMKHLSGAGSSPDTACRSAR